MGCCETCICDTSKSEDLEAEVAREFQRTTAYEKLWIVDDLTATEVIPHDPALD